MMGLDKRYWLLVFPVLRMSVPWIQYRTKASIAFGFIALWILAMMLSNMRPVPGWRRFAGPFSFTLFSLLLYTFLPEIWWCFDFGDHLTYNIFAPAILEGSMLFIPYYSFKFGKYREYVALTLVMLLGFCVTGLLSHSVVAETDGLELSRTLTSESDSDYYEQDVITAKTGGVGGYDYVYCCAFLVPIVLLLSVWHYDGVSKWKRGFALFSCAAMAYCVKTGGLGTPVFVIAGGCAMSGVAFLFRKTFLVRLAGVCMIAVLICYTYVPSMFSVLCDPIEQVGDLFEEGSIRDRFKTVADAFSGNESSYGYKRYERQRDSIEAFCDCPLTGIGAYHYYSTNVKTVSNCRCGGHSMLFDAMAKHGIFGLILFLAFWTGLMRFYGRLPKEHLGVDWMAVAWVLNYTFLFAAIANPFRTFFGVLYFVPGIVLCCNGHVLPDRGGDNTDFRRG